MVCFLLTACDERDIRVVAADRETTVNGGWAERGNPNAFVTVVVTDTKKGEYGFFGYREDELKYMGPVEPVSKKPAYRIQE